MPQNHDGFEEKSNHNRFNQDEQFDLMERLQIGGIYEKLDLDI